MEHFDDIIKYLDLFRTARRFIMSISKTIVCLAMSVLFLSVWAGALWVPSDISYQGRLTDSGGNPLPDDTYDIMYSIYHMETGGTPVYTSPVHPVQTTNGFFNDIIPSLPSSYTDTSYVYIGINVEGEELTPRTRLLSVPFAIHARAAAGWDYGIHYSKIRTDSTVTNVGIGVIDPSENLVIGYDLGSFSGNRIVVGDTTPGVYTGVVLGRSAETRGWMLWNNDMSYLELGTRQNGTSYGNSLVLDEGRLGLGERAPDTTVLWINEILGLTSNSDSKVGMIGKLIDTTGYGNITGGSFYASGGHNATGIRAEGRYASGGYSTGGVFVGDTRGIYAEGPTAGYFNGNVTIYGNLSKTSGSFKIDHPLDPANKFLMHSFVESPDMMNVYNGNITTDADGNAEVTLPDYFEALNKDFRYQLTVIGTFAQAIIAKKIQKGKFAIKTDKPFVEVSWQVTGIRKDPWANEHRIPVEVEKSENERGYYVAPELYGYGQERRIDRVDHTYKPASMASK
jgi:hypothetical protein